MKKISVVIPCYGTEQYVEKCIESIFSQSYKNLEIIAVNDCSKGNMNEILERLAQKDKRLIVVENEKNRGLFHTRIIGSEKATGDYIAFVDSDDYLDRDFYRLLINNIEENKSDVSIANHVRRNKDKLYISSLMFNTNDKVYDGETFLEMYFKQTGRNIRYHLIWNKLIKMELWKEVLKYVNNIHDRIVMTEDFVFSTLVLSNAKRVSYCDNAIYYYTVNDNQSTSIKNISIDKINKNIKDVCTVFDFVREYLKSKKLYDKYKNYYEIWEKFYLSMQINSYKILKEKNNKIESIDYDYENDKKLEDFYKLQKKDKSWDNYYFLETKYNDDYNKIKEQIMDEEIEIVSFDMFDTLVARPFLIPSDMFQLLNKEFIDIFNPIRAVDFSRIRKKSESELRDINYKKNIDEVTIDEIYDYISSTYNLDKDKLEIIKQKELEMELHFCRRRKSGYELYSLAKHMGKKVILTSDIYLRKDTLKKILSKNGYDFDDLYISSELLKTKNSGKLFEYIIEKEKTKNILHIGDNKYSDYEKPREYELKSAQLPKASDVMMGYSNINVGHCGNLYKYFTLFNIDHIPYEENYGVRCSLGIIANYYFDNPYKPFNPYSEFNGDPDLIGYYALGMQTISMCKWLFEDAKNNNINSISFMARDGFLPYEAAKIYTKYIKGYDDIRLTYTYVSRKSLMPLLLKDKCGISLIDTYLNIDMVTPRELMEQFEKVINITKKSEKEISKEFELDTKFKTMGEFNKCMSLIYDKCFDQKKFDNYYELCKKYFNSEFYKNAATFDIGYSGKPEAILSSVIEKPIRTYFIHANNSSAFNNTRNCNSTLCTFYNYKPTLTGTIRELFVSNIGPTCIGYKEENNEVKPILKETDEYNFYNRDMIEKIQNGSLQFVNDFCDYFKDYINEIDLNSYYMSVPLEYYYHYVNMEDRLPVKNLMFEDNVNNYVELTDFIFKRYKDYSREYCLGIIPKKAEKLKINYNLPRSRMIRIIYYSLHDKQQLKEKWKKWKNKKENPNMLPNSRIKRVVYYTIFDRDTIKKKIFKSEK